MNSASYVIAPKWRTTAFVEEIYIVIAIANSNVLTICRDGNREHNPGFVDPERGAAILVEEVSFVVIVAGTGDDVFTISRDSDRAHITPGGVVPQRLFRIRFPRRHQHQREAGKQQQGGSHHGRRVAVLLGFSKRIR